MGVRTLVNRVTMGYSQFEAGLADTLGKRDYVEYHLASSSINDAEADALLAQHCPSVFMTPAELGQADPDIVSDELFKARMIRAIYSRRQLLERMVEFWTDHFNIFQGAPLVRFMKTADDRDAIRAHALGKFRDLLMASCKSPAMLVFLDNSASKAEAPNENFARELFELRTIGPGLYTQADVSESARCFTGWSFNKATVGAAAYTFLFDADKHDFGAKTVMGVPFAEGRGVEDGEDLVNFLADHPATAAFVSRKLIQWLWGPAPDQAFVDSVTAVFQATDGDLTAVVRTILTDVRKGGGQPKLRRPIDLAAACIRGLPVVMDAGALPTNLRLDWMGQVPFRWEAPNGYPDTVEYWSPLLLPRWNFAYDLTNGLVDGITVDWDAFFAGAVTPGEITDRIDELLFENEMPAVDRDAVLAYLNSPDPATSKPADALALAMSGPAFQWY